MHKQCSRNIMKQNHRLYNRTHKKKIERKISDIFFFFWITKIAFAIQLVNLSISDYFLIAAGKCFIYHSSLLSTFWLPSIRLMGLWMSVCVCFFSAHSTSNGYFLNWIKVVGFFVHAFKYIRTLQTILSHKQ